MQNLNPEIKPIAEKKTLLERAPIFVLAQVVLMTVMMHACYKSGFYNFDDRQHITPFMLNGWKERLIPSTIPMVGLTLRAEYEVARVFIRSDIKPPVPGKSEPSSLPDDYAPFMRFMNAVYQMGAGFLLWQFLRRIPVGSGIAFLTALLWTAHPMNCENVCWVIERKSVLCAFFGFGAMLSWTLKSGWRYVLTTALYTLALGSKPAGLGLLPLFALLEIFVPRENSFSIKNSASWLRLFKTLLGPVAVSIAVLTHVLGVFTVEIVDPPGGSVWTALLTDFEIFSRYIHHILFPFRLTFYNSVEPIVSLSDTRLWLCAVAMLALFAGLIWATEAQKRPLTLMGILWFFAALGPNSNVIAIVYWMQDRYAFLSIPGLILAFTLAIQGIAKRYLKDEWLPRLGVAYALIFAGLLAYRAGFYVNSETLELDAAFHQPRSAFARLSAARIFEIEMRKSAPNGEKPDAKMYSMAARAAVFHYDGALSCLDLSNFRDPFDTRLAAVEILGMLGLHGEVKKALVGWLPPPNMQMLKVGSMNEAQRIGMTRREFLKGYLPSTLSRAWAISAESSFQLAAASKSPDEQKVFLEDAIRCSDQSMAVQSNDDSGRLVKARALIELSRLLGAQQRTDEARIKYAEGIEALKTMPRDSSWYSSAQTILKSLEHTRN